jgi:predicted acyltransferase
VLALDVFRGITIAGMVLINNPGSWSAVYSLLERAGWHGWTPTGLIFPFLLSKISMQALIYERLLASWASPLNASLFYAFA